MSVRSIIILAIEKVAKDYERMLAPLSDDLALFDSGLDSLSLAVLVARLEDELMVDPFGASEAIDFPVTLGDFVALYEHTAKSAAADFPR
jgi:Phosphopantetheine attachment site